MLLGQLKREKSHLLEVNRTPPPSELFITPLSEKYYMEKFGVSQANDDGLPFLFFLRL